MALQLERYNVRRSSVIQKLAVQSCDVTIAHERDRNKRVSHLLTSTHRPDDFTYAALRESYSRSIPGYVDRDAHALARESGFGAIVSGRAGDGYSMRP